MKLVCNPLNIEYRFQCKKSPISKPPMFREGADPTALYFNDTYFLFVSMSGGFYYSKDLVSWSFKESPELPIYDYAPDVRVVGGRVIFSASKRGEKCTFFASSNPLTEPFYPLTTCLEFWDPDIFEDEDGRIYFYWGCSSTEPIYGIEIDKETFLPIGEKKVIFGENEAEHGFERKGENNKPTPPKTLFDKIIAKYLGNKPFIEGAFMTKHNGLYYLQYAAPGTECNVYSDGVYVSDKPLGDFKYQPHNPFSSKPGGFITAAGHGSTIQDKYGNFWHFSTMHISVNEKFERRIGIFKCDFDKDGVLYCNQNFADYPIVIPESKQESIDEVKPVLNLLTGTCSASSELSNHPASFACDENIKTWWVPSRKDDNPYIQIDFGFEKEVSALQINIAEENVRTKVNKNKFVKENFGSRHIFVKPQVTAYTVEISTGGVKFTTLYDNHKNKTDITHEFISFDSPVKTRFVRVSNFVMPFNAKPAVSGIRAFTKGSGIGPGQITKVESSRSDDRLNIYLNWDKVDCDGYNVRYGIYEDKLYNSWQTKENTLDLSMINKNNSYYIAVDTFNENGVTLGKVFKVN